MTKKGAEIKVGDVLEIGGVPVQVSVVREVNLTYTELVVGFLEEMIESELFIPSDKDFEVK